MVSVVAVGQLCSKGSLGQNLAQCKLLVQKAVAAGAACLFLPEASDFIAGSPSELLALTKAAADSEFVLGLQHEAKINGLCINVGVHEPCDLSTSRVRNTLLWIDQAGNITQRYQKLHLFDVNLPGRVVLQESSSTEHGQAIVPPFTSPAGRIGLAICFDVRFPELSLRLRRLGADVLTFPSAFAVPTGEAHWETLLRARAIETQCYVVAAAQSGVHNEKRRSYGHSMIIDPWGRITAHLQGFPSEEPQIATAEIDLKLVEDTRAEMPLQRRTDVYPDI